MHHSVSKSRSRDFFLTAAAAVVASRNMNVARVVASEMIHSIEFFFLVFLEYEIRRKTFINATIMFESLLFSKIGPNFGGALCQTLVRDSGQRCKVQIKEVQIVYRLFLVNCYLLHVSKLPSQPGSNVGGLVIH